MNTIKQCTVDYIKSNRTVETITIDEKVVYVYNYEGNHYRLFLDVLELIQFFQYGLEPKNSFDTDEELDLYLLQSKF